jgi:hypothetical protein
MRREPMTKSLEDDRADVFVVPEAHRAACVRALNKPNAASSRVMMK